MKISTKAMKYVNSEAKKMKTPVLLITLEKTSQ